MHKIIFYIEKITILCYNKRNLAIKPRLLPFIYDKKLPISGLVCKKNCTLDNKKQAKL